MTFAGVTPTEVAQTAVFNRYTLQARITSGTTASIRYVSMALLVKK